eukprot:scaffold239720_cov33-Tisochrysis_lutea.AAC.1
MRGAEAPCDGGGFELIHVAFVSPANHVIPVAPAPTPTRMQTYVCAVALCGHVCVHQASASAGSSGTKPPFPFLFKNDFSNQVHT